MNIKNKLLVLLLIFVVVASISAVSAAVVDDSQGTGEGTGGGSDLLSANTDTTTLGEGDSQDTEDLTTGDDAPIVDASAEEPLTSVAVRVEVLEKNIKVGDQFRVKVSVENFGEYPAEDVVAGFSFLDRFGNPDFSNKLVDDAGTALTEVDGGYILEFGFLAPGETQSVILKFLATEPGEKIIVAAVTADNTIMEPDSYSNASFIISENPNIAKHTEKIAEAKTLPATGNPLALLALGLLCLVPCLRRR